MPRTRLVGKAGTLYESSDAQGRRRIESWPRSGAGVNLESPSDPDALVFLIEEETATVALQDDRSPDRETAHVASITTAPKR